MQSSKERTFFIVSTASPFTLSHTTVSFVLNPFGHPLTYFFGGVWLYFQTPLDWLALLRSVCAWCFAATVAPPTVADHSFTRAQGLLPLCFNIRCKVLLRSGYDIDFSSVYSKPLSSALLVVRVNVSVYFSTECGGSSEVRLHNFQIDINTEMLNEQR